MAIVNKIDSNATGLHFSEEVSLKTLAASPIWYPLEPNEYQDFGGQVTTVARNPINASRQRKKGSATDLDASGGFNMDLTQSNTQRLMQGFFFADFREKADSVAFNKNPLVVTNVDGISEDYDAAGTGDNSWIRTGNVYRAGDLVFANGFSTAANNGLKNVTAVLAGALTVAEDLTTEASPPAAARVQVVGFQFAAGDIDVSVGSGFATLTSTVKDFTELGLVPGEWIYIGGDTASLAFSTAVNNGFKRVRSVAANVITIDKSDSDMLTESSTTETVQMFFGRVLKNEKNPDLIKRRSYQLERSLGANNDTDLTLKQAEYLTGAIPNELQLNIGTADKATVDMSFTALDSETIDENVSGLNTMKSDLAGATKVALVESDLFNTSSDLSRVSLSLLADGDEAPSQLFAFIQELTLTINNNLSPNKAAGVFGGFDVTAGTFAVDVSLTAYFADVAAISAVRNTSDVSLDLHLVKSNAGVSFDIPVVTVGDGRPNVAQDESITVPLSSQAGEGTKINSALDHTLMAIFWDYLPNAAAV